MPRNPNRRGEFLGRVRTRDGRPTVKVKWDGLKLCTLYHADFIEVEQVCEVDLSRAPVFAALLANGRSSAGKSIGYGIWSGRTR